MLTSSSEPLKCGSFTLFCQGMHGVCSKVHAARAARLFFTIRPIKFLISSVVIAVVIVDTWELKKPRRRRQQKLHKFAYFTMKNSIFCTLCMCIFHRLTFSRRSRSFYDVKWPVSQLCGRCERMMTNVQFCLLLSKLWFQFNSRMVITHFSSIMTLNNWKIIAETRSYIFRWLSRFRRRRVCLSSLLKPKPAAVNLLFSVLAWL